MTAEVAVRNREQSVAGDHQGERGHQWGEARRTEEQTRPEALKQQQRRAQHTGCDRQQAEGRRQISSLLLGAVSGVGNEPGHRDIHADRANGQEEGEGPARQRVLAKAARSEMIRDDAEHGQVAEDEEALRDEGGHIVAAPTQPITCSPSTRGQGGGRRYLAQPIKGSLAAFAR